jgi:hypothetical protein
MQHVVCVGKDKDPAGACKTVISTCGWNIIRLGNPLQVIQETKFCQKMESSSNEGKNSQNTGLVHPELSESHHIFNGAVLPKCCNDVQHGA